MGPTPDPKRPSAADETWRQEFAFPEEDRHLFTAAPWDGGFRWFRSPNVVRLEDYQRRRLPSRDQR
jgi:hypothetical protein